ncbi:hypothetical protein ALI144C_26730 [Actinosynnema sp. ALI-1.44]|uniref:hypothetical protein n=1 Tax=Actinosynnema sp. ALI-1.44 TaxID=1933779 RepID=UPI00097BCA19|nr:hypothetical protein [Actinosynnema sp. ALI-1.44]ONI79413.1 hypothetical protein ALI144C_26730 [Actinosynnema sp. ALI-1.44]
MSVPEGDQQQLIRRIGRALLGAVPPNWKRVRAEYRSAGRHIEVDVTVAGDDGQPYPIRPPMDVVDLFGELRAAMYRPGRGTWLSGVYLLDHPSKFSAEFEPDTEPRWRRVPPPIGFQDELRQFPREDAHIPEWLRARAGLPPLPDQAPQAPPTGQPAAPTGQPAPAPVNQAAAPGQQPPAPGQHAPAPGQQGQGQQARPPGTPGGPLPGGQPPARPAGAQGTTPPGPQGPAGGPGGPGFGGPPAAPHGSAGPAGSQAHTPPGGTPLPPQGFTGSHAPGPTDNPPTTPPGGTPPPPQGHASARADNPPNTPHGEPSPPPQGLNAPDQVTPSGEPPFSAGRHGVRPADNPPNTPPGGTPASSPGFAGTPEQARRDESLFGAGRRGPGPAGHSAFGGPLSPTLGFDLAGQTTPSGEPPFGTGSHAAGPANPAFSAGQPGSAGQGGPQGLTGAAGGRASLPSSMVFGPVGDSFGSGGATAGVRPGLGQPEFGQQAQHDQQPGQQPPLVGGEPRDRQPSGPLSAQAEPGGLVSSMPPEGAMPPPGQAQ